MGNLGPKLLEELQCENVFTIGGIGISESVVVTWIIMAVFLLAAILLTRNLKVENPGRGQLMLEYIVTWLQGIGEGIIGEEEKGYASYLTSILIYLGASQAISVVTMIEMYIAPEMVTETSIGLSSMFTSSSMIVAIIVVGIAPAICEEAVFRGVFFNSIWNQTHGKWIPILVTAAVFGLFHGSIIRFFPTFLLGIVLGYLVYETNNMFYNVMFHAINNIIPVLVLYGMQFLMQLMARALGMNGSGMWNFVMDTATSQVSQLSPAFMGIYIIDGGVGLAILYLGNHVLHLGREGYPKELFPKEKRKQQFIWLALALALAVTGGMMIVAGTIQDLHF